MKVLLIVVDGMTPYSIVNLPEAKRMLEKSSFTMNATTVMPSVTLPCHMSLFHSVDPSRHGTTTNTYAPQVRPIRGLCEVLTQNKKNCAFFYSWEPLRDLTRPGSLSYAYFWRGGLLGYDVANDRLSKAAIRHLSENSMDFSFLYLGNTDEVGHKYGWMSAEYIDAMAKSWVNIAKIADALSDEYIVLITADHGGHGRAHGTELPEDMQIPLVIFGKEFQPGAKLPDANIIDFAPTITKLLGVEADEDWEGKSLV